MSITNQHIVSVPFIKLTGRQKDNHRVTVTDPAVVANFMKLEEAGFEARYLYFEDGSFVVWIIDSPDSLRRWFVVVDYEGEDEDEALFKLVERVISENAQQALGVK